MYDYVSDTNWKQTFGFFFRRRIGMFEGAADIQSHYVSLMLPFHLLAVAAEI